MGAKKNFRMGSFYRLDDRTGFPERAEDTQMEWNGLIVSKRVWEARQPQDFVTGVPDNQTVPYARPRQADVFLGPISTTLTANVAAGATTLPVVSSFKMVIGNILNIMLDTGVLFRATISNVPNGVSIVCSPGLPYTAASGNLVTDTSISTLASIG